MSVEWSVRLAADIALADLIRSSDELVGALLGTAPGDVGLVARDLDGAQAGSAGADAMLVAGFACLLGLVDGGNTTGLNVTDVGFPQDEEGGVWLTCSLMPREPVAFVISVCVAVAAAILTGADIVDEAGFLGRRVVPPARALASMRQIADDGTSPETRADRIFHVMLGQGSGGRG